MGTSERKTVEKAIGRARSMNEVYEVLETLGSERKFFRIANAQNKSLWVSTMSSR